MLGGLPGTGAIPLQSALLGLTPPCQAGGDPCACPRWLGSGRVLHKLVAILSLAGRQSGLLSFSSDHHSQARPGVKL
eukprot:5122956-Amphidinium_carterae.1